MTLPWSGQLAMSMVNSEFGWGLDMGAYAGRQWWTDDNQTGYFSTSTFGMYEFYGKRATPPIVPGVRVFEYTGVWSGLNTSVNLGAEDPKRYIVVAVQTRRTATTTVTHTGCTVNGVVMSQVTTHGNSDVADGEYNRASLYAGYVPTGTVVNSTVTSSQTGSSVQGIFRLVGDNVQVLQTAISGPSPSVFNVVPNSCIIASAGSSDQSGPISITNLTRHYDINGSGYTQSALSRYDYTAAAHSLDRNRGLFCAASFYSP